MRVVLARGALRGRVSGANETLVTYAEHLRRGGHDVSVLLLYPAQHGNDYRRRLAAAGVPVTSLGRVDLERALYAGRSPSQVLRDVPGVATTVSGAGKRMMAALAARYAGSCERFFRQSGADLVHIVGQDPGIGVLVRAARAAGRPVLFQELGEGTRPSVYPGVASSLAHCTEVAVLSPGIARVFGGVVPGGTKVSVLPIISEPPWAGAEASAGDACPSGATFGFAGSLDAFKGPLVMVEAVGRALASMPDLHLKVAGTGPEERRLVARARALGIAGACERPTVYTGPAGRSAFMRSVDVLVLPSLTEGTPNCIVEAMAHGLPVISTPVGGIVDLVTPDVGVLVPPGDPEALAGAMTDLAGDAHRRACMGAAALARYQCTFSPAAVMPLLLRTYRRVAGTAAPADDGVVHAWANGAA